ncbi:MAG: hypothetical protein ACREFJ_11755 [Acetobacteraceae bacterium]
MRGQTLEVGEHLRTAPATKPAAAALSATIAADSTLIRSCGDGERHLEVRVGNVETAAGSRPVFGAVARPDTDIAMLIRRSLEAVGGTAHTAVIAFTGGCPGRQSILAEAGVTPAPIADRFHIAMRLQHAKQAANGSSTDEPTRVENADRRRNRAPALADLEWYGHQCSAHVRAHPQGHARFQGPAAFTVVGAWLPASYGTRCTRSTTTSAARAAGSSTTPNDTVQACGLELP